MPKLLLLLLRISRPVHFVRWTLFLAVVAFAWLVVENPILQAYLQERERRDNYRAQVAQLQQKQQRLQAEVADLKTGGYLLEKAIQDRFPMHKPGQKVLIFRKPGERPEETPSEAFDPDRLPELPPGEAAETGAAAKDEGAGEAVEPPPAGPAKISKKTTTKPTTTKGVSPSVSTSAKTSGSRKSSNR